MDIHTATETAYKNGYKQGVKDLSEKLLKDYATMVSDGDSVVFDTDIYNVAKEMGSEVDAASRPAVKDQNKALQRCVDCVHHDACKTWVNHVNRVMDNFNLLNRMIGGDNAKDVTHIDFPLIQTPEFDMLCEHFATKENETI